MKPEILLIEAMMPEIEAKLDADYQVHRYYAAQDKTAFAASVASNIRAIVTGGGSGASNALVDALPKLEIIAINGVGTDAVDLEHARSRSVRVTTTPDLLTDDVADLGVTLLLTAFRQVCPGDRFVRDGHWARNESLPLARKITGKRLGILGMGRIGRAIAHRATGFDMSVAYHDVRALDDVPYRYVPELVELARQSDALIVAASGGPQSRGLVNASVLEALGPDGILVNVARGSIVDEPALVAALVSGGLGAAGLDVFMDEPNVPHELLKLDNVVLQPHRASATLETRRAMGELVLANIAARLAGKDPLTAVV
jgi:lactate dehydrogenase-like 2-hydroxyacid dehydrogenase